MSSTFEDLLARDGQLVYKIRGISMEPMLRQKRDLVIIRVPSSRLGKYDVALYKRGKAYVLHRVIGVEKDFYRIRGDHTYSVEIVPDQAVIGVLVSFRRKEKLHEVNEKGYRLYARCWHAIYPFRYACFRIRRFAVTVARKAGILPLLRKLRRKDGAG